jgi:hypothetical protein
MISRRNRKARRAGPCPRCRGWIWVGARTIGLVDDGRVTWICVRCALALAKLSGNVSSPAHEGCR